jgi:hypothetical protein
MLNYKFLYLILNVSICLIVLFEKCCCRDIFIIVKDQIILIFELIMQNFH